MKPIKKEHGISLAFFFFGMAGNFDMGSPLFATLGVFMILGFGAIINPFKKYGWAFFVAGGALSTLSCGFPYSVISCILFNVVVFLLWWARWSK